MPASGHYAAQKKHRHIANQMAYHFRAEKKRAALADSPF